MFLSSTCQRSISTQYSRFKADTIPKTTLKGITGQESGIIYFNDKEVIVCHWESVGGGRGIPRIEFDGKLMSLGEELSISKEPVRVDVEEWITDDCIEIIYSDVDNPDEFDTRGLLYNIEVDGKWVAMVLAPDGWN